MKNPCHDKNTGVDCPRRCAGCASTCPEWAEYTEERNKTYKKRLADNIEDNYSRDAAQRRYWKHYRRNHGKRR